MRRGRQTLHRAQQVVGGAEGDEGLGLVDPIHVLAVLYPVGDEVGVRTLAALFAADRRDHLEALAAGLESRGVSVGCLTSKVRVAHRRALVARFEAGDLQVLLAMLAQHLGT